MIKVAPIQLLSGIFNVPKAKRAVSSTLLLHLGPAGLPALSNSLALLPLFPPPLHLSCVPLHPSGLLAASQTLRTVLAPPLLLQSPGHSSFLCFCMIFPIHLPPSPSKCHLVSISHSPMLASLSPSPEITSCFSLSSVLYHHIHQPPHEYCEAHPSCPFCLASTWPLRSGGTNGLAQPW